MIKPKHKFAIVFGLCVTIASLSSGCATTADPNRVPAGVEDLNSRFQIDCSRKQEQIDMLQSMRQSRDETFEAYLRLMLQPWRVFTDPNSHQIDAEISQGNPNKYINYHLNQLRYCP
jgi:type IV pilus biogenesis protein CpaD/CtpE